MEESCVRGWSRKCSRFDEDAPCQSMNHNLIVGERTSVPTANSLIPSISPALSRSRHHFTPWHPSSFQALVQPVNATTFNPCLASMPSGPSFGNPGPQTSLISTTLLHVEFLFSGLSSACALQLLINGDSHDCPPPFSGGYQLPYAEFVLALTVRGDLNVLQVFA
ncbi:hypothetical protein BDW71DRAFT_94496 [Aspergillus fruticulosus]